MFPGDMMIVYVPLCILQSVPRTLKCVEQNDCHSSRSSFKSLLKVIS